MDTAAAIAQALTEKVSAATTKTARGTVVATATDGFVTFTVGGLPTPRKGVWVGPGVPQVGDIITYIDEGRGIPLVLGSTGPKDLHITATKSLIVGNTTVNNAGVTTTGSFVDGSGNLRAAINTLTSGAWTNVTFQNGWSNFGLGYQTVQYRKVNDIVQIRGMMAGGSVGLGTPAFTLPSGFRPIQQHLFGVASNDAFGRVDVSTAGNVTGSLGSNVWFSFGGVHFSIY